MYYKYCVATINTFMKFINFLVSYEIAEGT